MLSVPPASTTRASPSRMARAAQRTACSPEPHAWLTVKAGRSSGTPARWAIWRAVLGPPPAWRAWPKITWSTRSVRPGARPARDRAAAAAAVPRSAAVALASAPPNLPIGVRTGAARTMSRSLAVIVGGVGGRRADPAALADAQAPLGALELRRPLADVGVEPLAGVLALEQLLLEFALDGEAALEGYFRTRLHGALDASDRLRGLVRRAELLGVGVHLLEEIVAGEDLVDDAEPLGLFEGEQTARGHQLDRLALADQ